MALSSNLMASAAMSICGDNLGPEDYHFRYTSGAFVVDLMANVLRCCLVGLKTVIKRFAL